jgi:hypothetical protein
MGFKSIVILIEEWPKCSEATLARTPYDSISVAFVCIRSCSLICLRPFLFTEVFRLDNAIKEELNNRVKKLEEQKAPLIILY